MRILAVSGSLRADSYNSSLLRAASDAAPEGVEVELFDRLRLALEHLALEAIPAPVAA